MAACAGGAGAGVDGEAGGGHVGGVEDAFGVELLEEGDGGQLLVLVAGGAVHAGFELGEGAVEFDEVDVTAGLGEGFDEVGEEGGADGVFGVEGEDQGRQVGGCGFFEDGEPDVFAKGNEGLGAEVEDGEKHVHRPGDYGRA